MQIARALIRNPKILLLVSPSFFFSSKLSFFFLFDLINLNQKDEATSALDTESEKVNILSYLIYFYQFIKIKNEN